jgi:hypothetical protein
MDNNQDNSNPENKNNPNKFNINSYWIYGLIILGILGCQLSMFPINSQDRDMIDINAFEDNGQKW